MHVEENEKIDPSEVYKSEDVAAILAIRARRGDQIKLMDGHMRNVESMLLADILHYRGALDHDEFAFCVKLEHSRAWVGHALGLNRMAKTISSGDDTPDNSATLFIAVSLFGQHAHHIALLEDAISFTKSARVIPRAKTLEDYSRYLRQLKDSIAIALNNLDRWEVICKKLNHGDGRSMPRVCQ